MKSDWLIFQNVKEIYKLGNRLMEKWVNGRPMAYITTFERIEV